MAHLWPAKIITISGSSRLGDFGNAVPSLELSGTAVKHTAARNRMVKLKHAFNLEKPTRSQAKTTAAFSSLEFTLHS